MKQAASHPPVYTIGHSTRTIAEFAALLQAAGVQLLIDVRTVPRSRTNPQYNLDRLADELAPWQITHRYIAELGGLRGKSRDIPPEVNAFWQNQSFHNYADYALSGEFRAGLHLLREAATGQRTAIMCAEAVWWRCHRRIIADYLIDDGWEVFHIMSGGRTDPARMTSAARPRDGGLVYPAAPG